MVAEHTMSRPGTDEICMARDPGTTIPEIIFICFFCSSFGTLGLKSMGFRSGFRSQRDRRRPKCYENGEMQVHSSEIPQFLQDLGLCGVLVERAARCNLFFVISYQGSFLLYYPGLCWKKPNPKKNIFKWQSLQNEFSYKKTSVQEAMTFH